MVFLLASPWYVDVSRELCICESFLWCDHDVWFLIWCPLILRVYFPQTTECKNEGQCEVCGKEFMIKACNHIFGDIRTSLLRCKALWTYYNCKKYNIDFQRRQNAGSVVKRTQVKRYCGAISLGTAPHSTVHSRYSPLCSSNCKTTLMRTANLEQLRAFPLALPSYQWYWFHAAHALFSGINAVTFSVLIRFFTRLPPGSRRIKYHTDGVPI